MRSLLQAGALAVLLAGGGALAAPAQDLPRTYRLHGRVQVDARPFPARDEELGADAVVSAGRTRREVRLRVAALGMTCDLTAALAEDGALSLAPGQRCTVELRSEEGEGHVLARLESGRGRMDDEALSLVLAFTLDGTVRLHEGGALDALGKALALPGSGGQPVPVRGRAQGQAEGHRDRSRAGVP